MKRLGLLLLLFGLAAPATARGDGASPKVLASPALPQAFLSLLPDGRVDGRITWPLPEGDLLVLGIPCEDAAAHHFGTALGIREVGECLYGGYAIARWHEHGRWIACVLAHDGVSLRRGLADLLSRQGPVAPRTFKPRFRIRALGVPPDRRPDRALVELAVGSGANRVLFDPASARRWADATREIVPLLVRQGIRPGWRTTHPEAFAGFPTVHPVMEVWADRVPAGRNGNVRGVIWTPGAGEALTPEAARTAKASHQTRLLVEETWHAPWTGPGGRARIPTLPPPAPAGVRDVVAGIVVEAGPGSRELLEAAWERTPVLDQPWRFHLLPHLPRRWESPTDLLQGSARALRRVERAPSWSEQLASRLEADARALPDQVLEVPRVPRAPETDGRLDDPAWAFANGLRLAGGGRLMALADGQGLHLGLRADDARQAFRLEVTDRLGGTSTFELSRGDGARGGGDPDTTAAVRRHPNGWTAEMRIDPRALAGDAYPTRLLDLVVTSIPHGRVVWRGKLLLVP